MEKGNEDTEKTSDLLLSSGPRDDVFQDSLDVGNSVSIE